MSKNVLKLIQVFKIHLEHEALARRGRIEIHF